MNTENVLEANDESAILIWAKSVRASIEILDNPENVDKHLKYYQSIKTRPHFPGTLFANHNNFITVTNWSSFHIVDPKFVDHGNHRIRYSGPMPHDIRGQGAEGFFVILNGVNGGFNIHTCVLNSRVEQYISAMSHFGELIYE